MNRRSLSALVGISVVVAAVGLVGRPAMAQEADSDAQRLADMYAPIVMVRTQEDDRFVFLGAEAPVDALGDGFDAVAELTVPLDDGAARGSKLNEGEPSTQIGKSLEKSFDAPERVTENRARAASRGVWPTWSCLLHDGSAAGSTVRASGSDRRARGTTCAR